MSHLGTPKITVTNTSGGAVTIRGKKIQPGEDYALRSRTAEIWDEDPHFEALLNSGTLSISRDTRKKHWKKSTAESTTTATTWQRKARLNINVTQSGTYRMAWTGDISSSANNQEVASRVQLNDTAPNLDFNQSKGKDIVSVAGFHYAPLATGTHTLDLDWKAVAGGTAKIEKARLEYTSGF